MKSDWSRCCLRGFALRSSGLCLLCHPLGGFDLTAAHWWFSLCGHRFLTGHLLSCCRSPRGLGLELLRQSTYVRSNVGMRLLDLGLDCLIAVPDDSYLIAGCYSYRPVIEAAPAKCRAPRLT